MIEFLLAPAQASAGVMAVAMNFIVTLILGCCGLGMVGICGFHGLKFTLSHDWSRAGEELLKIGLGGGMIMGAKQIGSAITGGAEATTGLFPPMAPLNDQIGDLLAITVYYGLTVAPVAVAWVRRHRHAG